MPTICPPPPPSVSPRLRKKTLALLTVATSIAPENGIETRGCMLKPSSVLSTSMSRQSETRTAQFGLGRFTRTPVLWLGSAAVKRSVGYGISDGDERSNRAWTPAASAGMAVASTKTTPRTSAWRRPCQRLMRVPPRKHDVEPGLATERRARQQREGGGRIIACRRCQRLRGTQAAERH